MSLIIIICLTVSLIALKIWLSSPKNIGKFGEKRVAMKLDWLSKEYVTFNDVLLPTNYGTTQIDHIVVSPYGIFVIETKNYKGWIFGHEKSEEWKQSLVGKKSFWGWSSEQHKFLNPIRQNATHVRAIKSILKDIGDFPIIPIVVFSNNADLKISVPNHIVINRCNLNSVIKSYKTQYISIETVQLISSKIVSSNITLEGSRDNHIQNIQSFQQKKAATIANRICPKCGGNLVERNGKYGRFLGCSNYPQCSFTHKI